MAVSKVPWVHQYGFLSLKSKQHIFYCSILYCKEGLIYVFSEKALHGLGSNFDIHVSVSNLYNPRIAPHIFRQADRSREYNNRSQTHECGNWDWGHATPFLGIFVSTFLYCFFALYRTAALIRAWGARCRQGACTSPLNSHTSAFSHKIFGYNKNNNKHHGQLKRHFQQIYKLLRKVAEGWVKIPARRSQSRNLEKKEKYQQWRPEILPFCHKSGHTK